MNTEEIVTAYRELLEEVSTEADRLGDLYKVHMVCRKGCSDCCSDISLLPLEWFALNEAHKQKPSPNTPEQAAMQPADRSDDRTVEAAAGKCPLLHEDSCTLYPFRPLICRTHGLPLLYLIEEYDSKGQRTGTEEPEWQISWCDLNFTEVTEDNMEEIFDPEDVLNMEEWNTRLKELNRAFLDTPEGRDFNGENRIPIAEILS
ncbi:MAG: YkgJ family cysteine cluster protein [Spirochaetales bacterium]|nr:YkgJ family cysteine cluster protein [Spirochaetales bacterium]